VRPPSGSTNGKHRSVPLQRRFRKPGQLLHRTASSKATRASSRCSRNDPAESSNESPSFRAAPRMSPRANRPRRSSWCTRTRRSFETLYPQLRRNRFRSHPAGSIDATPSIGEGENRSLDPRSLPVSTTDFVRLRFHRRGFSPQRLETLDLSVGSSRPSSIHNRLITEPKSWDRPSFRRRDFNAPSAAVSETA